MGAHQYQHQTRARQIGEQDSFDVDGNATGTSLSKSLAVDDDPADNVKNPAYKIHPGLIDYRDPAPILIVHKQPEDCNSNGKLR